MLEFYGIRGQEECIRGAVDACAEVNGTVVRLGKMSATEGD